MASEEQRAWITLVVSVSAYIVYAVVVVGRLNDEPASQVPYRAAMLVAIGGSIVVAIVLSIVAAIVTGRGADKPDVRDREIHRASEYIGQSFVVIGGVAALVLAMLEVDFFWIANAVYLCFVLSALVGSVAKIAAYRVGFQGW